MKALIDLINCARLREDIPIISRGSKERVPVAFLDGIIKDGIAPIVFEVDKTKDTIVPETIEDKTNMDGEAIIDNAPFKIFSMENLESDYPLVISNDTLNDTPHKIPCIIAIETSPCVFKFIAHIIYERGEEMVCIFDAGFEAIFRNKLEALSKQQSGVVTYGQKIRHLSSKNKTNIRKLIFVSNKKVKYFARPGEKAKRDIDYSHRWLVRGHWRAITGLGKDREGNYCVKDFTWVVAHAKGPEDKPIIKKVRLVK